MKTISPYIPADVYLDFNSSTDKKLNIAVKISGSDYYRSHMIFMGMHGCVLGWDEETFYKKVRSHISGEVSDDAMNKLFDLYIKFNKKTLKCLKREAENITKRVEKVKAFDFDAAEKRLKRICKLLNQFDMTD